MGEKENTPTQPQQLEMYNRMEPTPNPNVPMSSPPTYNQATQPHIPPR